MAGKHAPMLMVGKAIEVGMSGLIFLHTERATLPEIDPPWN